MESNDRDERFSWRAATTIMAAATIFTLASRLLGIDPFTWIFDIFIVYLTTGVLLGGVILNRMRPIWTRESAIVTDSPTENKGV